MLTEAGPDPITVSGLLILIGFGLGMLIIYVLGKRGGDKNVTE